MMEPYYSDDAVTIYHGDALEITEVWCPAADFMVTDPPYGRGWRQGQSKKTSIDYHPGIIGDANTISRDFALDWWRKWVTPERPAIAFGDTMMPAPPGTRQVLIYRKPPNAGTRGATKGFRRDVEAIYLIGPWESGLVAARSSVIETTEPSQGNPSSPQGRYDHPHAKPLDVMRTLIQLTPWGIIADPFMGSGTTLRAAKDLGRKAIGIEIEERYCEIAAKRMAQEVLDFGAAS